MINQENFQQICQEEEVKQEITATLEALCGIAEATQIDNVAILFNFLMDFLTNCIGLMEVYKNTPETVNLIIEVFVEVAHKQICYLGEVSEITAQVVEVVLLCALGNPSSARLRSGFLRGTTSKFSHSEMPFHCADGPDTSTLENKLQ